MQPSPSSLAAAVPSDAADWPDDFARRYRGAGYWQDTTVFDALDACARRHPDALAIVVGQQLGHRLPERAIRIGATVAFVVFGIVLIVEGVT